jgi:hypothetical protein
MDSKRAEATPLVAEATNPASLRNTLFRLLFNADGANQPKPDITRII